MKKNSKPVADAPPAPVREAANCRAFLTTAELQSEVLPLSRRAIFSMRKRGIIPAVESGGKVLFHKQSVIDALLRRQIGGAL